LPYSLPFPLEYLLGSEKAKNLRLRRDCAESIPEGEIPLNMILASLTVVKELYSFI